MQHGEAIIRADEIFFYLEFEIKNISDYRPKNKRGYLR